MDTEKRKEGFLEHFEKNAANISQTCKKVGISRQCFYDWRDDDDDFRAAIEEIQESLLDFTESKLMQKISEGSETCIIFMLKTRGKKRGYVEKQEVEMSGNIVIGLPPELAEMMKQQ